MTGTDLARQLLQRAAAGEETWFEVKIDRELALLFQRIVNVHSRIGRARRKELLARLALAIGDPEPGEPGEG
jgi:hypothetical protein